ncbi:beta-ketoacyl-[acyl-carrier-protein] synthase family protein [Candidatus Avelusimicrobium alvi]|uniref:beta-ketoacyl-[acyl-carrier-protein] synthase family protein n=1 Tax=Candidatus Avelusimicrobium alvi TaxID=3416221 RepID=UPI003D12EB4C
MPANNTKVVITGAGAVSPYGAGVAALWDGILAGRGCMHTVPELEALPMVKTKVAATVPEMDFSYIPRRDRRSMSRMALYAYAAAQEALRHAGYEAAPQGLGFFMGSTLNSISVWMQITSHCHGGHLELVKTSDFLQIMNHSPLATVSQALKINGPCVGASDACATGLMNAGLAYMAVKTGFVKQALCGGTEEYHPMFSACFDIMQATSHNFNDRPAEACRPFDKDRTGLVASEGCGLLFVESEESAKARGAEILAEIIGFASNTETENMAYPSAETLRECMQAALADAGIQPEEVDLLNAHATGTVIGDIAETQAAAAVFGPGVKINSLKGHLGHTMGASGSLETVACLETLRRGVIPPTQNLHAPDERCARLEYVRQTEESPVKIILKNSFAIGGNNCSLILRRPQ